MRKSIAASVGMVLALGLTTGASHAVVDRLSGPRSRDPRRIPMGPVLGMDHHQDGQHPRWREGEILVKLEPGFSAASEEQLHRKLGASCIREFPGLRLHQVRLPKGVGVEKAVRSYESDPGVEYAEPDYVVSIQTTPNDPRFGELWGLHNVGQTGGTSDADIDAPEAWSVTTGSGGVVVAVIDTGIDDTHPDLMANRWVNTAEVPGNGIDDDVNGYVDDLYGINAISGTGQPWDDHGHGTHVAGILGAKGNNGTGIVGVNWNVKIMSCKFLDLYGYGYTSDAVECLQYVKLMRDRGVNVVATSNSWGGAGYSQSLRDAIDAQREILFFAAAGNNTGSDDSTPFYPASYDLPSLISVAASTHDDALASFSNFGKGSIHVAAPGDSILSTLPPTNYWNIPGGYGSLSGTSMATPHVSGLAALIKAADPSRDWRAIKNLVLSGSDPRPALGGKVLTGRRINASGSLICSSRDLIAAIRPPTSIEVGTAVTLRVLSIRCGTAQGPVVVTTLGGETLNLLDDGVAPDAAAGDGVFSRSWTPLRNPERLDISSPAGAMTLRLPEPYIVHYLPDGTIGAAYQQTLTATGVQAPLSWSVVSGGLPPGLSLDGATGAISGLPAVIGTSFFTVRLNDATGLNMTRAMSLRVGQSALFERFARTLHEEGGADGRDLAVDGDGNIIVLGTLGGHDYNSLEGKSYLAKYTPTGARLWLTRYTTGFLRSIAVGPDRSIFAAGGTAVWDTGDTLLVKFDSSGHELWERTYDNAQGTDIAMGVALDANGNILLGGISESPQFPSMYVQKISAAGNLLWTRTFSRGAADYGYAVAVDGSGNCYLGGSSATVVPEQGGYAYHYDSYVRKYDPSGGLSWSRSYDSGSRFDFLKDLAVDGQGNVCALVHPEEGGYTSFVTMKFDPLGGLLWARTFQSVSHQPSAIAVDAMGNVYAAGASWMEAGTGDWDYLLLKYDASGSFLWKKDADARYYISEYDGDFSYALAVSPGGGIYLAGTSSNGVDGYDMLLVKYSGSPGPGGAGEARDMTAERAPMGTAVTVHYVPGCGAEDHAVVWGAGPITAQLSWTHMACALGSSGTTSFDPGPVSPGSFVYFVVVAQNDSSEGSYGRSSSGTERPEATGVGACDLPRNLEECNLASP